MSDFERFVGVWELDALLETFEENEEKIFLEGNGAGEAAVRGGRPAVGFERPAGMLIYLASGEMSVHFAGTSRIYFQREFFPTPRNWLRQAPRTAGTRGGGKLDEARGEVLHHVEDSASSRTASAGRSAALTHSQKIFLFFLSIRSRSIRAQEAPDRVLRWRRRRTAATP